MELALSLGHTENSSLGFSTPQPHHTRASSDPPLQLHHLLPSTPVLPSPRLPIPWLSHALGMEEIPVRALDDTDEGAAVSSPNSAVSSFQMDFCRNSRKFCEGDSEEDENGTTRKKLRLSKTQSAFLEDSFKEHTTLNPKQKLVLAKELNLRPRQVEVWFQNRRARTKLKQTEVDCEYLKRCCESLTEENKRLQKELQELRALKTCEPFFKQLPATTLTMCPSCERVAATTSTSAATTNNDGVSLDKPRIFSSPPAAGPHGPPDCFFI